MIRGEGFKKFFASLLAGITSFLSPAAALDAGASIDYLAYPPLPVYIPEEGIAGSYYHDYLEKPTDPIKASIYQDFFNATDDSPQVATFGYYGTPGTGDDPLSSCTPILRYLKFPQKDWEGDTLNVLYTERTTFSQNVYLVSESGNIAFEYIEFSYNSTSEKWIYRTSSYESNATKFTSLNCAYIVGSNPLSGTADEQYTGHNIIVSPDYNLRYAIYNGTKSGHVTDPLYGFWLGYKSSGSVIPPDPPDPPGPSSDLNKDLDGDGIPDINIDTDDDGKADVNIDTNGDDIPDLNIDTDGDLEPDLNIDTNGDGKPDLNIDTNGDRQPDLNIDSNGDKKPDLNIDTNGDNKPDLNIDNVGDGKPHVNVDTNGDGKPDINIDTNGDNRSDINIDTNGDYKPDINIDTDGDNKADLNIDTDGDQKPDVNIDTDGDFKPDINIDDDGDLIPDRDIDTDGDGKPDKKVSHSDIGDGSEFVPDDSYKPNYEDWHLFNPFDYTDTFKDPFADDEPYDPLAGWEVADKLPGYDKPDVPTGGHIWEPFVKPVEDMVNKNLGG